MAALWLLAPQAPLLFQGQELGSSQPFLYFADHADPLANLVRLGRRQELSGFRSTTHPDLRAVVADPESRAAFLESKLDNAGYYRENLTFLLFQDLLKLRREDPTFRLQRCESIYGAVLGPEAFALRYLGGGSNDRLLLINLGRDLYPMPNSEPLLGTARGHGMVTAMVQRAPTLRGFRHPGARARSSLALSRVVAPSFLLLGRLRHDPRSLRWGRLRQRMTIFIRPFEASDGKTMACLTSNLWAGIQDACYPRSRATGKSANRSLALIMLVPLPVVDVTVAPVKTSWNSMPSGTPASSSSVSCQMAGPNGNWRAVSRRVVRRGTATTAVRALSLREKTEEARLVLAAGGEWRVLAAGEQSGHFTSGGQGTPVSVELDSAVTGVCNQVSHQLRWVALFGYQILEHE